MSEDLRVKENKNDLLYQSMFLSIKEVNMSTVLLCFFPCLLNRGFRVSEEVRALTRNLFCVFFAGVKGD